MPPTPCVPCDRGTIRHLYWSTLILSQQSSSALWKMDPFPGVKWFDSFYDFDPTEDRQCIHPTRNPGNPRCSWDADDNAQAINLRQEILAATSRSLSISVIEEYILCNCCTSGYAQHRTKIRTLRLLRPLATRWRDEILSQLRQNEAQVPVAVVGAKSTTIPVSTPMPQKESTQQESFVEQPAKAYPNDLAKVLQEIRTTLNVFTQESAQAHKEFLKELRVTQEGMMEQLRVKHEEITGSLGGVQLVVKEVTAPKFEIKLERTPTSAIPNTTLGSTLSAPSPKEKEPSLSAKLNPKSMSEKPPVVFRSASIGNSSSDGESTPRRRPKVKPRSILTKLGPKEYNRTEGLVFQPFITPSQQSPKPHESREIPTAIKAVPTPESKPLFGQTTAASSKNLVGVKPKEVTISRTAVSTTEKKKKKNDSTLVSIEKESSGVLRFGSSTSSSNTVGIDNSSGLLLSENNTSSTKSSVFCRSLGSPLFGKSTEFGVSKSSLGDSAFGTGAPFGAFSNAVSSPFESKSTTRSTMATESRGAFVARSNFGNSGTGPNSESSTKSTFLASGSSFGSKFPSSESKAAFQASSSIFAFLTTSSDKQAALGTKPATQSLFNSQSTLATSPSSDPKPLFSRNSTDSGFAGPLKSSFRNDASSTLFPKAYNAVESNPLTFTINTPSKAAVPTDGNSTPKKVSVADKAHSLSDSHPTKNLAGFVSFSGDRNAVPKEVPRKDLCPPTRAVPYKQRNTEKPTYRRPIVRLPSPQQSTNQYPEEEVNEEQTPDAKKSWLQGLDNDYDREPEWDPRLKEIEQQILHGPDVEPGREPEQTVKNNLEDGYESGEDEPAQHNTSEEHDAYTQSSEEDKVNQSPREQDADKRDSDPPNVRLEDLDKEDSNDKKTDERSRDPGNVCHDFLNQNAAVQEQRRPEHSKEEDRGNKSTDRIVDLKHDAKSNPEDAVEANSEYSVSPKADTHHPTPSIPEAKVLNTVQVNATKSMTTNESALPSVSVVVTDTTVQVALETRPVGVY